MAQPADSVWTGFEQVAQFEEAVGVSVSPDGSMYIADRGTNSIVHLNSFGDELRVLGGPGISEGQFDDLSDIDPTNGLILVVADAGNGRIQRFSREFLFLESLRVGGYSRSDFGSFSDQPRYRQGEDLGSIGDGRPVAVITTQNNATFSIDANENVIIQWDRDRNVVRIIGDYSQGEGALINPVDIELGGDGSLFVLDTGHESILVYDSFGGYIREMGSGLFSKGTTIKRIGEYIVVVKPEKVLFFQERGALEFVAQVNLDNTVVDIAYLDKEIYLLTPNALYKYEARGLDLLKPEDQ